MTVELSVASKLPHKIDNDTIRGGIQLIRELLTAKGFTGLFHVAPVERISMRSEHRIRVTTWQGPFVRANVRPGDNGTAWVWTIMPPQPLTPEHVHKLLTSDQPAEPENLATPRFAPPTVAGPPAPIKLTIELPNMEKLVARLATAGERGTIWREREGRLQVMHAALEAATEQSLAAQQRMAECEAAYNHLRAQHLTDTKGKEAAAFLETLRGLDN